MGRETNKIQYYKILIMIDDNMKNNFNDAFVLMEVLKILRDEQNRESRKIIYETYLDSSDKHNPMIFSSQKIRQYVEKINGDFDEIGFLIEFGYLKELPFFHLYSDVICRLWDILNPYIFAERKYRKNINSDHQTSDDFLQFFEKLAKRALSYRKNLGLPEPKVVDLRLNTNKL